jgi:putative intracellular protease/amidase
MRRRAAVILYPGCVFFEIALAAELLAKTFEVQFFTPHGEQHSASCGANLAPHGAYAGMSAPLPAVVLVPGGDPGSIIPTSQATSCLQEAYRNGAVVAGICAGNLVMASAGLLVGARATHNYTEEHASAEAVAFTRPFWQGVLFERSDVVVSGRLITAQPWAHVQYAAAVGVAVGLLSQGQAHQLVAYHRRTYADA